MAIRILPDAPCAKRHLPAAKMPRRTAANSQKTVVWRSKTLHIRASILDRQRVILAATIGRSFSPALGNGIGLDIMVEQVWRRDENWVGSQIEDNFVMVNIDTGMYVTLNSSANAVWDALEQPRTQAEIEGKLCETFAVDAATCAQSVTRLLDQMRELKLAAAN